MEIASRNYPLTPILRTLQDWLEASPASRVTALAEILSYIERTDIHIQAWVHLSSNPAHSEGPLAGIPFGVKDVIETANLRTEFGSALYKGRQSEADAAIVHRFRNLGAVLLGKTATAAFAYRTPALTRNPRNLDSTPGGSSSGSAAAVASGMVPIALGTQTLGSVLRPASYCGVTGFKPSYDALPMQGVLPFARTLDTLGLFTPTPVDMRLLWKALGFSVNEKGTLKFGVPAPMPEVDPSMATAFQNAVSTLRRQGFQIEPLPLTPMLNELAQKSEFVMAYEASRFHRSRFERYGAQLDDLAVLVKTGLQISDTTYEKALEAIVRHKQRLSEICASTPLILTPAATGPAPLGLASTGDARMNAPWTALGGPALSVPMPCASGLPLGLQIASAPGQDALVLRSGVELHRALTL